MAPLRTVEVSAADGFAVRFTTTVAGTLIVSYREHCKDSKDMIVSIEVEEPRPVEKKDGPIAEPTEPTTRVFEPSSAGAKIKKSPRGSPAGRPSSPELLPIRFTSSTSFSTSDPSSSSLSPTLPAHPRNPATKQNSPYIIDIKTPAEDSATVIQADGISIIHNEADTLAGKLREKFCPLHLMQTRSVMWDELSGIVEFELRLMMMLDVPGKITSHLLDLGMISEEEVKNRLTGRDRIFLEQYRAQPERPWVASQTPFNSGKVVPARRRLRLMQNRGALLDEMEELRYAYSSVETHKEDAKNVSWARALIQKDGNKRAFETMTQDGGSKREDEQRQEKYPENSSALQKIVDTVRDFIAPQGKDLQPKPRRIPLFSQQYLEALKYQTQKPITGISKREVRPIPQRKRRKIIDCTDVVIE